MINSNKENEINSLYANCQLEKNNITKEECSKIYSLIFEQGLSKTEAIKIINGK
jgi:hypothetical protein